MLTPEEINKSNQEKFQHKYTVENVSIKTAVDHNDYFYKLVKVRITYLKEYCLGKKVLDIGCGSGDYLFEIKGMIADGCGIDYTDKAIEAACSKKGLNLVENLKFIKADAQKMPFEDGSFDLVYSFSTLSSIPDLGRIIKEVERVLKPEGLAILEIGNRLSLNTFVCDAHPELAKQTHVRISDMRKMLDLSRMSLVDQRAFGILPFWGR